MIEFSKEGGTKKRGETKQVLTFMSKGGKVVRGYHCPPVQQPYWNTIYLEDFPDDELLNMIDLAYDTVFSKFSKKEQKRILGET